MTFFTDKKVKGDDESDKSSIRLSESVQFQRDDILICATHGKIYAIHKRNGIRLWSSKFPTGASGGIVALFVTDYDKLIAGANGKTACLDLMSGETLWVNKMPGFGYSEVSVISTPSRFLSPREGFQSVDPPGYNEPSNLGRPIILAASKGKIMAIDSNSGEEMWRYNCPGGWYNIPVAIIEPPSLEHGRPEQLVYVGAGKWVYCLQAQTGEVVWSCKVSGAMFGLNYMTLATPWSSRLAAEAYSAFSQNPSAQARDWEREQERKKSLYRTKRAIETQQKSVVASYQNFYQ
ncbi:hypothetical protein RMCBS344292_18264 [Rhizopus microsporus]|nr:hypothetical protein RMCBS344292_18264 [Rhizopus microsporus]